MQDIMGVNDIAFPNLGLYLRNIPQGFTVFGFYISLYGVIIAIGVMAGISIAAGPGRLLGLCHIWCDFRTCWRPHLLCGV